jgi:2-polyprenyl-3-methyl-5-hydroxy-6-metoxy-1,4-benzoquinol methylase
VLRDAARTAAWPLRRFIDPRFGRLEDRFAHVERRLDERMRTLEDAVHQEVETATEFFTLHGRTLEDLRGRLEHLTADASASAYVGASLDSMGDGLAALLNYAGSHIGFDAQASLWFNPSVSVEHRRGQVNVGGVNERIIEMPYAMSRLGTLARGAAIIDFGAVESTLSLSLASLGYRVTALDLRRYPLEHPNLTSVAELVEEWDGPGEAVDAIASVSTLEHVGRSEYGGPIEAPEHDRVVLERLAGWLKKGGMLVFTAPYGRPGIDALQRTYGEEQLDRLLEGWTIADRTYGVCTDGLHWVTSDAPPPASTWEAGNARGVVMVTATRRG